MDVIATLNKICKEVRVYEGEGGNPATTNPTKEERLCEEIARLLVAKRQPRIKADELKSIFKELGYGEKEGWDFLSYIRTPEGRGFFRNTIRLELWKAGYRLKEAL